MYSDILVVTHKPIGIGITLYGPEKWKCGDDDIFWHYLKLRDNKPEGVSHMKAEFYKMTISEKNE